MILESLKVNNFRVFEGVHTFDLSPRVKYSKKRPIILFGGLNGAGKTTSLIAVRLVLYGRQALGFGVSQKEYREYLEKAIHKPKRRSVRPNSASIELTFKYAHLGVENLYTVKRHWMVKGKNSTVVESLTIAENGEQCQGFLNELIPIGVADLFFFDGEKIAELAEDSEGQALGDSIKKLIGIDLIETLDADLGILLRSEVKKGSVKLIRDEISELEKKLNENETIAEQFFEKYQQERIAQQSANTELAMLETQLSASGGAWAASREEEIRRQADMDAEKKQLEENIRNLLAGSYPFSIGAEFAAQTLSQLRSESAYKHHAYTAKSLKSKLSALEESLSPLLDKSTLKRVKEVIRNELSDLTDDLGTTDIVHDISDRVLSRIEASIADGLGAQKENLEKLANRLQIVENELDKAGKNIARAPEQAALEATLHQIAKATQKSETSVVRQKEYISQHKSALRDAIANAKALDKLTENLNSDADQSRLIHYANGTKSLLKDFSKEVSIRKVKELEEKFIDTFYRLARKEDVDLRASIDPETFSVTLLDESGNRIDKNDLSAGEKQIYAIAVLEALARTSGRRLPIIIDTPLARLDSVHRDKLIKNYFPYASHQVLILSTDTEVDEVFYSELSPSISHAFKLEYDSKNGSTMASEGYFWRNKIAKAS